MFGVKNKKNSYTPVNARSLCKSRVHGGILLFDILMDFIDMAQYEMTAV